MFSMKISLTSEFTSAFPSISLSGLASSNKTVFAQLSLLSSDFCKEIIIDYIKNFHISEERSNQQLDFTDSHLTKTDLRGDIFEKFLESRHLSAGNHLPQRTFFEENLTLTF